MHPLSSGFASPTRTPATSTTPETPGERLQQHTLRTALACASSQTTELCGLGLFRQTAQTLLSPAPVQVISKPCLPILTPERWLNPANVHCLYSVPRDPNPHLPHPPNRRDGLPSGFRASVPAQLHPTSCAAAGVTLSPRKPTTSPAAPAPFEAQPESCHSSSALPSLCLRPLLLSFPLAVLPKPVKPRKLAPRGFCHF